LKRRISAQEPVMKRAFALVLSMLAAVCAPARASADDLPPPWQTADLGGVGRAGSASYSGGAFVVQGAGADIWDAADAFRFVYQPVTGDATIVARVVAQDASHPFAKTGIMMRQNLDPSSSHVILDMKPNGELEFMARFAGGEATHYIGGADRLTPQPWLKLVKTAAAFVAYQSVDGREWTTILSIQNSLFGSRYYAGLVVTSHDVTQLNTSRFDNAAVDAPFTAQNLLRDPGFEEDAPPALDRGWRPDDYRQTPAKSETHQPRSGAQNGACWTTTNLDCGLYQDLAAPSTGTYQLQMFATADREGGLVGANVNGALAATSDVEPRGFGNYGGAYTMAFRATAGDTIRVWMYSPAVPGYVVVDDVGLAIDHTVTIARGSWTIGPWYPGPPLGRFDLAGENVQVNGSYDGGVVDAAVCAGATCRPGQTISLRSTFENLTPLTIASFARGTATVNGTAYSFLEFGGQLTLEGGTVVLPTPTGTDYPERVSVSAPFTFAGDLKGFEVLGLRDPKLVFDLPLAGRGTATLDLLSGPNSSLTFYQLRYEFAPTGSGTP
jgi:hypothetical protein